MPVVGHLGHAQAGWHHFQDFGAYNRQRTQFYRSMAVGAYHGLILT
jgi:hypothetical protein